MASPTPIIEIPYHVALWLKLDFKRIDDEIHVGDMALRVRASIGLPAGVRDDARAFRRALSGKLVWTPGKAPLATSMRIAVRGVGSMVLRTLADRAPFGGADVRGSSTRVRAEAVFFPTLSKFERALGSPRWKRCLSLCIPRNGIYPSVTAAQDAIRILAHDRAHRVNETWRTTLCLEVFARLAKTHRDALPRLCAMVLGAIGGTGLPRRQQGTRHSIVFRLECATERHRQELRLINNRFFSPTLPSGLHVEFVARHPDAYHSDMNSAVVRLEAASASDLDTMMKTLLVAAVGTRLEDPSFDQT